MSDLRIVLSGGTRDGMVCSHDGVPGGTVRFPTAGSRQQPEETYVITDEVAVTGSGEQLQVARLVDDDVPTASASPDDPPTPEGPVNPA